MQRDRSMFEFVIFEFQKLMVDRRSGSLQCRRPFPRGLPLTVLLSIPAFSGSINPYRWRNPTVEISSKWSYGGLVTSTN